MKSNLAINCLREFARSQIFRITRILKEQEQSEMANALCISKSMISLIENSKRSITPQIINKYIELFKVTEEEFIKTEEKVIDIILSEDGNFIEIAYVVAEMLLKKGDKNEALCEAVLR